MIQYFDVHLVVSEEMLPTVVGVVKGDGIKLIGVHPVETLTEPVKPRRPFVHRHPHIDPSSLEGVILEALREKDGLSHYELTRIFEAKGKNPRSLSSAISRLIRHRRKIQRKNDRFWLIRHFAESPKATPRTDYEYWTEEDMKTLRESLGRMHVKDIATMLKRSEGSIRQQAFKYDLPTRYMGNGE